MKHTLTVNLNGKLFNIDNDAYNLLDSYIKSLKSYFAKDSSKKEIINDFEGRIQELLSARKPNTGDVISIDDVEEVIKQIGKPTEFEVDAENTNESPNEYKVYTQSEPKRTKRLFRNPNDKMLGGVCSGIAAFFNIDPTIIRIALVLLVLFSVGSVILIYIVLWILLPEAKTAEEQLQMRGEPITLENIGKIVSENAQTVAGDIKNAYNRANNNGVFSTLLKILSIIIGAIIIIPLIFILLALIFILFTVIWSFFAAFLSSIANLATISFGLFVGIPLVALIYSILSAIFKWNPLHKSVKIISLLIWLISCGVMLFSALKIDWNAVRNEQGWRNVIKQYTNNKCGFNDVFNKDIKGNGNIISKTFETNKDITGLILRNNLEVAVQEDTTIKDNKTVVITTDENILSNLGVVFNKHNQYNNLRLFTLENTRLRPSDGKIILKVKSIVFNDVYLSGASELNINSQWKVSRADINLRGNSEIVVAHLDADKVFFTVSGASEAKVTGKARYADYNISGASDVENRLLVTDSIYVAVSGASELDIYPNKYLKGNVSGSSNVYYYNTPTSVLDINSSGVSSVKAKLRN